MLKFFLGGNRVQLGTGSQRGDDFQRSELLLPLR
jgi:hypothetical protein